jgi:hypothetical protein
LREVGVHQLLSRRGAEELPNWKPFWMLFRIWPPNPLGHEKHAGRKAVREAFGLDKPTQGDKPEPRRIRDLSTKNMDVCSGAFQWIKDYLEPSDTQHFHLFLMGCEVGEEEKSITL